MEPNPFDEFDNEVNPFDEFDEVESAPVEPPAEAQEQPREENTPFVDTLVSAGSRILNPVGSIVDVALAASDYYNSPSSVEGEEAPEEKGLLRKTHETSREFEKGLVGGAGLNAAKNVAKLGAAVATYSPVIEAYKYLSGEEGPDFYEKGRDLPTQAVDAILPEFNPQNTAQEVGETVGEIGAGIVAGNKVYAAVKAAGASEAVVNSLAQKSGPIINYLSRLTTRVVIDAAATGATADEDSDTLLVGENAMEIPFLGKVQDQIPILRGLDGKSESEAQQIIEKRLNIMLDSMILAAPIELLADGGKALFGVLGESIIKPIQATFLDSSNKVKEGMVMEDFLQGLREAIDPKNPNSAVADQYVSEVIDILKNDEEALIVFPGLGKQGPRKVELDTAGIIARGIDEETGPGAEVKGFFDRKRKEVTSGGGEATRSAADRTVRELEQQLSEGVEGFGGEQGISRAGQTIQESGEQEVGRAFTKAESASRDLTEAGNRYGQILAEDEGLGPRMLERAQGDGTNIGVDRNKILSELVESVRQGNRTLLDVNKLKWQNIPEGVGVNEDSLALAIQKASDDGVLSPDLKHAFRRAGADLDALLDDEVTEAVIDFAKLQNELRGPLSREINAAYKNNTGKAKVLEDLRDEIVDVQPEWLGGRRVTDEAGVTKRTGRRSKEGRQAVQAMDEAVAHTRDVIVPNVRSGLPNKIRNIDKANDAIEANQLTKEVVDKASRNPITDVMEHFANTISRPEYGGKQKLLIDLALADVADKMSTPLRAGGITGINPKEILRGLDPYRNALNANKAKFGPELKRLSEFEDKLIKNSHDIDALNKLVKEYTKDAEKTRKTVYETSLKEWFSKEGVRNPDAYQSFKKVFLDPQITSAENAGRLDDMIQRMDPPAREGAIAAWLRTMKDELFQADGGLNTTRTADILSSKDNQLLTVGRKLLGDDAQAVDIIRQLMDPSLNFQRAKKSGSIRSPESMASSAAAKRAVNRLVLATKGPLTKFGGRVTSAVSTVLDWIKPDETNKKILDAMMADRKEFLRVFNEFANAQSRDRLGYRRMFWWLVKSGIYNDDDENKFRENLKKADEALDTAELFGE